MFLVVVVVKKPAGEEGGIARASVGIIGFVLDFKQFISRLLCLSVVMCCSSDKYDLCCVSNINSI